MRPLESLSLWERLVLALAIIVVTLLLLMAISHFMGDQAEAQSAGTVNLYEGIPLDAKLLALDKRALDEAYHNHLVKLFTVYVTDGAKQSQYIKTGLVIARKAYGEAARQIQAREEEINRAPVPPERPLKEGNQ